MTYPSLQPFIPFCTFFYGLNRAQIITNCDAMNEALIWVEAEESKCQVSFPSAASSERWLIGLNYLEDKQRNGLWFNTAQDVIKRHRKCLEVESRFEMLLNSLNEH